MRMIDRVASNMKTQSPINLTDDQWRYLARRAIEAMREITPEMTDLYPPFVKKGEFMESWRAMIDAALRS